MMLSHSAWCKALHYFKCLPAKGHKMVSLLSAAHTWLEKTIKATVYWKIVSRDIQIHVKWCSTWQHGKQQWNKCGELPVKQAVVTTWECLCADVIGPYTIKENNNICYKFMCITLIDPLMGMLEIKNIPIIVIVDKRLNQWELW